MSSDMTRRLAGEISALLAALWAAFRWAGAGGAGLVDACFATSCLLVSFYYAGLWERGTALDPRATLARLVLGLPPALGLMEGLARVFGAGPRAPTLLLCAVVAPLVLFATRLRSCTRSTRPERVLLLGASPLALKLSDEVGSSGPRAYVVVGLVEDDAGAARAMPHVQHLGSLADLGRILRETRPDRVVVTLTARRGRLPVQLLLKARLRGICVEDGVDASERLWGKVPIEAVAPSALVFSAEYRRSWIQQKLSRAFSVAIAAVALALLAPVLGLIALLIILDSEGPPLFLQERVGLLGRRFRLAKFRTMRPAVKAVSAWEKDNDARITRVGRVLRRFRIDELPQLWNVLNGDMNLVGPRPHPLSNFDLFLRKIPYYSLRASVPPGITGWAQIRYGYANDLDEETEKMRYDLYYIKRMSLALDLRILLETARLVLSGRDASALRERSKVLPFDPRSAELKAAAPSRRPATSSRPAAAVDVARWGRGA